MGVSIKTEFNGVIQVEVVPYRDRVRAVAYCERGGEAVGVVSLEISHHDEEGANE